MRSERAGARHLHPLSMVRDLPVRELLGALVPGVVALGALGPLAPVALGVAVLVILPAWRLAVWRRHTYEVTGDAVVERRGVLARHERVLELSRIQQVEVTRTLLDRLVGTAELRLETAAEAAESELRLRVLGRAEAERLREQLRRGSARPSGPVEPTRPPRLVAVPLGHVVVAAVTGSRLLLVPFLIGGLLGILQDLRLVDRAREVVGETATGLGLVGAAVAAVVIAVLAVAAAAVAGVLRDGGFEIVDRDGDLHVRRGVLSTREAVVPRGRLQRLTIRRSWLRRWLGFGTVTLHSAGGPGGQAAGRRLTVPLVPEEAVPGLVVDLLGHAPVPDLATHPARARRRAVARWLLRLSPAVVALAVAAVLLWSPPAGLVGLVPLVAAVPLGLLEHAHLGNGRSPRLVAARHGAVNLTTVVAPRRKVQGTTVRTTPFQRRRRLATLRVHLAGASGGVDVRDVDTGRADRLGSALTRRG